MLPRGRALAVLALVTAVVAGCGGASPAPRPATRAATATSPATSPGAATGTTSASPASTPTETPPAAPAYSFTLRLSGADPIEGNARTPAAGGCGTPSGFATTIAGTQVRFQINNRDAPAGQPVQLSPGDIVVQVGSDVWNVGSSSNAPHGTEGTLVHNADGSGAATFTDLYLAADPMRTPQESGSVSWTCR
jgi:hypothetical protein